MRSPRSMARAGPCSISRDGRSGGVYRALVPKTGYILRPYIRPIIALIFDKRSDEPISACACFATQHKWRFTGSQMGVAGIIDVRFADGTMAEYAGDAQRATAVLWACEILSRTAATVLITNLAGAAGSG